MSYFGPSISSLAHQTDADSSQVEALGKEKPSPLRPPKPDDLATICYTSGTTNVPKGALLTHYNLLSGGFSFCMGNSFREGTMLSYLPLSHICEQDFSPFSLSLCAVRTLTGRR